MITLKDYCDTTKMYRLSEMHVCVRILVTWQCSIPTTIFLCVLFNAMVTNKTAVVQFQRFANPR